MAALCRLAGARSHGVRLRFHRLRSTNAAAAVDFQPPHCRTAMADSASESDTDGAGSSSATPMSTSASNSGKPSIVISQFRLEELTNRLASLQQENKVLKIELETFKLKCKALQEENRDLRKASVTIVSNVSKRTSYLRASPILYCVCQLVSYGSCQLFCAKKDAIATSNALHAWAICIWTYHPSVLLALLTLATWLCC